MSATIDELKRRSVDCPKCPHCGATCGVPIRAADWNHRAEDTDRLVCPACGKGWHGDEADFAKAEAAQRAWDLLMEAES